MATKKIPTGQIEWLVNRHHVGDTDAEIQADFDRRMTSPEFTPAIKRKVITHALKHHAKNRALFYRVATGRL